VTAAEPVVYLKGRFVPASKAAINIYDLGIVMGATLTEMTRTFAHRPFRLEDHVDRLYRSCRFASIVPPLSKRELLNVTHELIDTNRKLIDPRGDLGIVHFITPGENPIYAGSAATGVSMVPTLCVHSFDLPLGVWEHLFTEGAHVVTPSIRHIPPQCLDPKTKNRSRLHWHLAEQQSHAVDPKAISLLLDLDGNVTECAGSNFVIVIDKTIVSPTRRNILWGITLQTVSELAGEIGMTFVQRDLQVYDVINADEAWLTTTPYAVAPVTRINDQPIGNGAPGPRCAAMLDAFSRRVGMDIRAQVMRATSR
jgi:branched-chain amino acid aminotransferase